MDACTVVKIFDNQSGSFSNVSLPPATDAVSLRYFANGSLAVGLKNYSTSSDNEVVIVTPNGVLSSPITVGDATVLNPFSTTAVLAGGPDPAIVNSDGTTQQIALPSDVQPDPTEGGVQVGENGELIVPTSAGLTILHSASDATVARVFTYPTVASCGPISGQGVTGSTGSSAGAGQGSVPEDACVHRPTGIAVGAGSALWILDDDQQPPTASLTLDTVSTY
jgi:hypothetical protein